MRLFYHGYRDLLRLRHAVRDEVGGASPSDVPAIPSALRSVLANPSGTEWKPRGFHPPLAWTHYRSLLKVERREVGASTRLRRCGWTACQLKRSVLFPA